MDLSAEKAVPGRIRSLEGAWSNLQGWKDVLPVSHSLIRTCGTSCLCLRLTERTKRDIRCLFGCRRCRADQTCVHLNTTTYTCGNDLVSRRCKHSRSRFGGVMVTVSVSSGRGSSASCWLRCSRRRRRLMMMIAGPATHHSAGLPVESLRSWAYDDRLHIRPDCS